MNAPSSPLIKYDAACRAIAEAHSIDEVKDVRDKAAALAAYAKQAHNPELEQMASEITLRAKRRMGEISLELEKAPGKRADLATSDQPRSEVHTKSEVLKAAGISNAERGRVEQLAKVPGAEFEAYIAKTLRLLARGEAA